MKRGKYEAPSSPKRKRLVLLASLVLLLCVGVGATLAQLRMISDPVINTFQSGSAGAEVVETVVSNTKKAIQVKNTGASPAYVRVRLVSYYEDADGNILARSSAGVTFTPGEDWVKLDQYYYYRMPLASGASTTDLLDSDIAMEAGQVIEVLADTVQTSPDQAVKDAWGVDASAFIR